MNRFKKREDPPPNEVMTLPEVAKYLRCAPGTIYRLAVAGRIHGFKRWLLNRRVLSVEQE